MKMSSIARKIECSNQAEKGSAGKASRRFFYSIALVGPDGSGKSSVARSILETSPLPIKYIYMGANIDSSNIALPTSRLSHKWKVSRHKKSLMKSGGEVPEKISMHGLEHRIDRRGKLWGFARLLRRVSEEVYRQIVSYAYQARGNVVLYDRHFLFDACPVPEDIGKQRQTDRAHCWFLRKLYPRPGLVIILDAPADVLYARKQEVPIEYLESNRRALAKKKYYASRVVTVDTNKPFEEVVEIVNSLIVNYCTNQFDG
jgi:thymidylate kinase